MLLTHINFKVGWNTLAKHESLRNFKDNSNV
jgi:hypothetical protein